MSFKIKQLEEFKCLYQSIHEIVRKLKESNIFKQSSFLGQKKTALRLYKYALFFVCTLDNIEFLKILIYQERLLNNPERLQ